MVVSQHVTGGEQSTDLPPYKFRGFGGPPALPLSRSPALTEVGAYHCAGLIRPQSAASLPRAEFLAWHKEQVFKTAPREL
jgi:hypothetical protein